MTMAPARNVAPIRLRLPAWYRAAYYAMLALVFLDPVALVPDFPAVAPAPPAPAPPVPCPPELPQAGPSADKTNVAPSSQK